MEHPSDKQVFTQPIHPDDDRATQQTEQNSQEVELDTEKASIIEQGNTTIGDHDKAYLKKKEYHSEDTSSISILNNQDQQIDVTTPVHLSTTETDMQVETPTSSTSVDNDSCKTNHAGTITATVQPPMEKDDSDAPLDKEASNPRMKDVSTIQPPSPEINSGLPLNRQSSPLDHEYLVKSVDWLDPHTNTSRVVRIITQNENGPCPLVCICNVLFIRGDLNMRPFEREKVTFEYLLEILGDYLLNHAPPDIKTPESPNIPSLSSSPPTLPTNQQQEPNRSGLTRQSTMEYVLTYRHNLDMALTLLPRLQTGLDVNVQFSSIHDFEPTAELALFDLFDVDLVHGWIIDPQDEEGYRVVNQCKSYNGIVECIVRGKEIDVETGNDEQGKMDKESRIHDGLVASQFLDDSATQLTYYGIALLTDTLPKNKLCVLFRNNHFSTLYKHPISDKLYTLVTDSGLVSEANIVWETLGDVDQSTSEFVDSHFARPPPTRIAPITQSEQNRERETEDLDYAIALSLQQHQQEMARTSQVAMDHSNRNSVHSDRISVSKAKPSIISPSSQKKKSCVIS